MAFGNWGPRKGMGAVGATTATQSGGYKIYANLAKYVENTNVVLVQMVQCDPADVPLLNTINPSIFEAVSTDKMKPMKIVNLKIKEGNEEEFEKLIPTIVEKLRKTGKYDNKKLDDLKESIMSKLSQCPTPSEIKEWNLKLGENWKDMLLSFNDEETKKRFMALRFYNKKMAEFNNGYVPLSDSNIAEIVVRYPQATFVTSEHQWGEWNRIVVDRTNPIYVTANDVKMPITVLSSVWDQMKKEPAYAKYRKMRFTDLRKTGAHQIAMAVEKRTKQFLTAANRGGEIINMFYHKTLYDVSSTQVVQGERDIWAEEFGMINNITGELNEPFLNAGGENAKQKQDNGNEEEKEPEVNPKKMKVLEKFNRMINKRCETQGIKYQKSKDVEVNLCNAIFEYEKYIAGAKYNIQVEKDKVIFASGVLAGVAASLDIVTPLSQQAFTTISNLDDEKKKQILTLTFQPYSDLIEFMRPIKESKERKIEEKMDIMNKGEYYKFFGIETEEDVDNTPVEGRAKSDKDKETSTEESEEIKNIKESFFKDLDRFNVMF